MDFVHGLGFSFGLREMLDAKGPHVWTSLAAFNVGVELGQLLFAAEVLLGVYLLPRGWPEAKRSAFRAIAVLSGFTAIYWTV